MPSTRRLRLLLVGIVAVVVITLVYTSQLRTSQELGDFYQRTEDALDRAKSGQHQETVVNTDNAKAKSEGERREDSAQMAKDMQARLKAAEQKAKDSANAKLLRPEKPAQVIGVGSAAGGQQASSKDKDKAANKVEETDEEHVVESTMNDILKKSPSKYKDQSRASADIEEAYRWYSHYLLQNVLPILKESQRPPSGGVHD